VLAYPLRPTGVKSPILIIGIIGKPSPVFLNATTVDSFLRRNSFVQKELHFNFCRCTLHSDGLSTLE
jgi:hypothetical protein